MKSNFLTTALLLLMLPLTTGAQVVINEYSASNLTDWKDNHNAYEDWVELYNAGSATIDISGYHLSDKVSKPKKWEIPEGTTIDAGGYLLFWLSGRDESSDGHFHTNFKLTQTKSSPESIVFSDADGEIIEQHELTITQLSHSVGRTTDGANTWSIFANATPEDGNAATAYSGYAASPQMSVSSGFYDNAVTVELSTDEPDAVIRYTTNGFAPTTSSPEYTGPIHVTQTTVVKARTFSNNGSILPSFIEFNTYFINEHHTLPVVSIASDSLEIMLNDINKEARPIGSMEFFVNGEFFEKGYGEFNSHGQDSWINDQRSLDYVTRDEMGYANALHYKLYDLTDRDKFQRIILRAAGDDNYPAVPSNPGSAHVRDLFVEKLSVKADLFLDERKSERCILYVNGKYWGVYATREKVDDPDYTKYYYGQDKYHIDFLMIWGETWVEYGDPQVLDEWRDFHNYIMTHDMSNQANFDYVTSLYDPRSLVDYILINSWVVCSDWMNWNVGWWRGTDPDGSHKRWGYILWDEDATFGHYINYTDIPSQTPDVSPCYPEDLPEYSDPEGHVKILNKLLENPGFEQYYKSRYIDLRNTYFSCDSMLTLLNQEVAKIAPEMQRHINKWGGSYSEWEQNVQDLRNFITERCAYINNGLTDCYDYTGPYDFTIDVQPAEAGQVVVNSLSLNEFPWSGTFFGNVDILLKAVETNGAWEFDKWIINNHTVSPDSLSRDVVLQLTASDTIVALFKERTDNVELVINEINYHSADDFDTKDWVEFFNPYDSPVNMSNWVFKDGDDDHAFTFPSGTVLNSGDYLVLSYDKAAFQALLPDVTNVIGDMGFKFSNNNEVLRLYDNHGVLSDSVHYDDEAPWPVSPDGQGNTLQLISPELDNTLASSWSDYNGHGTPGKQNGMITAIAENELETNFDIQIFPNPMVNTSIIRLFNHAPVPGGKIIIYNLLGQPVYKVNHTHGNQAQLQKSSMTPGVYLCRWLDNKNEVIATTKLMVQ